MAQIEMNSLTEADPFFREYTSRDAILKYTKATAGFGISYLLDHDYKQVYLEAIKQPASAAQERWNSDVGIWVWWWHESVALGLGLEARWPQHQRRNRYRFFSGPD